MPGRDDKDVFARLIRQIKAISGRQVVLQVLPRPIIVHERSCSSSKFIRKVGWGGTRKVPEGGSTQQKGCLIVWNTQEEEDEEEDEK